MRDKRTTASRTRRSLLQRLIYVFTARPCGNRQTATGGPITSKINATNFLATFSSPSVQMVQNLTTNKKKENWTRQNQTKSKYLHAIPEFLNKLANKQTPLLFLVVKSELEWGHIHQRYDELNYSIQSNVDLNIATSLVLIPVPTSYKYSKINQFRDNCRVRTTTNRCAMNRSV